MIAPSRRIWLYPDHVNSIEIIVLGEPEEIAPFMFELRSALATWLGFQRDYPIMMGEQLIGFRAERSQHATHADPLAEALRMFTAANLAHIEWTGTDGGIGIVGTW